MTLSRTCLLALTLLMLPAVQVRSTAQSDDGWQFSLPGQMERALNLITAQSLRSHLSFLASDALNGRTTPSIGQDAAAEYIAAQFRKAGLEPIGSTDYFQISTMLESRPDCEGFKCEFSIRGKVFSVPRQSFTLNTVATLEIKRAPVFKMTFSRHFREEVSSLSGKILLVTAPEQPFGKADGEGSSSAWRQFMLRARSLSPALIVWLDRQEAERESYFDTSRLRAAGHRQRDPLTASIAEPSIAQALGELPDGETGATFSLHVGQRPPVQRRLRNVAAILRGSDPILRETYVLLAAHYDGTGPTSPVPQDRIWNAANDDASGVASVLDVALALGSLSEKPRRSIVFLAFFGEEEGMLGSRYYADHPLVPLRDTIAAINLEQVGRTDSSEGDQTGKASVTGCDYSDVVDVLKAAGEQSGITLSECGSNSDTYFTASDNIVLAEMGVPSHTLCVSYMYPDYHGPADHWDKIDFNNMARVTRMAARALLALSMSERVPAWNKSNPRTQRFDQARGRRHESQ